MYEFIVLAQLMHGPAHGYLIAKIINDMIGPYARLSYGRLYPLMAKLEQNGLIAVEGGDASSEKQDRQLRVYAITHEGRMRFQLLMKDTGSNPGDYQRLFAYKVSAFSFITPVERLHLIDHYIHYCQAHIFHLQGEAEDMVRQTDVLDEMWDKTPGLVHGFPQIDRYSVESILNAMKHSIDQWQLELEWARCLCERELALVSKPGNEVSKL